MAKMILRWKTVTPQHGFPYEAAYIGSVRVGRTHPPYAEVATFGVSISLPISYNSCARFPLEREAVGYIEDRVMEFMAKAHLTYTPPTRS